MARPLRGKLADNFRHWTGSKSGLSGIVLGMVWLLVMGIYSWRAESSYLESATLRPEDSYYNLLVQGFRAGQLNVKREPAPGLAKLANPYDPAANAPYVWDLRNLSYEMSYYKGKLYLYFGVTPALVLFWPYAALTGHYLLHRQAVVIFFGAGVLIAAGILRAAWLRYFSDVSIGAAAAGLLAIGLATGVLEALPHCDVYEVPKGCAFAFTMLTLAALWRALHDPKRPALWTTLASLAFGTAIGARPSLLFGSVILLIPAAQAWLSPVRAGSEARRRDVRAAWRRIGWLSLAAMIPVTLIGAGLMLYNFLRFDSPFEFGWHYQLTDVQNTSAQQFSLRYLGTNAWTYFLQPIRWVAQFPYLQPWYGLRTPSGYYGVAEPFCGILCNYPVVWLALAAPLGLKGRPAGESACLRWFLLATLLAFATSALTLSCFFCGSSSYVMEFLGPLMLLVALGILGVERALAASPGWRRAARCGWCLLLAYSLAFNLLASFKIQAATNDIIGNSFAHQKRMEGAIEHHEKAVALDPAAPTFRVNLGLDYANTGRLDESIRQFREALRIEPNDAAASYDLGMSLAQVGRVSEAVARFLKASELDHDFAAAQDPGVNNNCAWSLATSPDPSHRNGKAAVLLAEAACRKTHYDVAVMVGTLAAAYAEDGRFDEAVATAEKACALASAAGDREHLETNRKLLELYRRHQPFHEAAPAP
jgi:tetratricopeptide (TPR) repeat protein